MPCSELALASSALPWHRIAVRSWSKRVMCTIFIDTVFTLKAVYRLFSVLFWSYRISGSLPLLPPSSFRILHPAHVRVLVRGVGRKPCGETLMKRCPGPPLRGLSEVSFLHDVRSSLRCLPSVTGTRVRILSHVFFFFAPSLALRIYKRNIILNHLIWGN